jgi:hypothetical protein
MLSLAPGGAGADPRGDGSVRTIRDPIDLVTVAGRADTEPGRGCHMATGPGDVTARSVSRSISSSTWTNANTPAGGDVLGNDW